MMTVGANDEYVPYFVFFPFLQTREKFTFGGIDFSPVTEIEPTVPDSQRALWDLSKRFLVSTDCYVKQPTATVMEERPDLADFGFNEATHSAYGQVLGVRELFNFMYSSLHPTSLEPFLTRETCDVYALREKDRVYNVHWSSPKVRAVPRVPEEALPVPGYSVIVNDRWYKSITTEEDILPASTGFILNNSQSLSDDISQLSQSSTFGFLAMPDSVERILTNKRLLKSLKWYNLTTSRGSTEEERIVNLSISFESLFDLERDSNIANRFRDILRVFLGTNRQLEQWARQFYEARSQVVHRGSVSSIRYSTTEGHFFRKLTDFGRRVYQLCFAAVQRSDFLAAQVEYDQLLISNRERFVELTKMISKNEMTTDRWTEAEGIIRKIEQYSFVPEGGFEVVTILSAVHCLCKAVVERCEATGQTVPPHFQAFLGVKVKDWRKKLFALNELHDATTKTDLAGEEPSVRNAVVTLINVAYLYTEFDILAMERSQL